MPHQQPTSSQTHQGAVLAYLVSEIISKDLHANSTFQCGKMLSPLTMPYLLEGISILPEAMAMALNTC